MTGRYLDEYASGQKFPSARYSMRKPPETSNGSGALPPSRRHDA